MTTLLSFNHSLYHVVGCEINEKIILDTQRKVTTSIEMYTFFLKEIEMYTCVIQVYRITIDIIMFCPMSPTILTEVYIIKIDNVVFCPTLPTVLTEACIFTRQDKNNNKAL